MERGGGGRGRLQARVLKLVRVAGRALGDTAGPHHHHHHHTHTRPTPPAGCGETRLALADFRRAVELDGGGGPVDSSCRVMKAVCLHSLGLFSAAYNEYSALLKAPTPPPLPPGPHTPSPQPTHTP